MTKIASTPQPPYYAVIFTSLRNENDDGYAQMAQRMFELAAQQDGYLGAETAHEDLGITVSYWKDLESVKKWKANAEHLEAQKNGRDKWYSAYHMRISKVEDDYMFESE